MRLPSVRVVSVVLFVVIAGLGIGLLAVESPPEYRAPGALAALFVLASAGTMWWWRSRPLTALVIAAAVAIANASAGYTVGAVQYPVYLSLYAVMAWAPRPQRKWAVAVAIFGVVGYSVADRGAASASTLIGVSATCFIAMLLGDGLRSRRELAASQEIALDMHDRERAAAMERLVLEERARLARELHDSVGHAINVMVMQAGVGRHVFAERPAFAKEALENVETLGRVALGELDAVLRVLRPIDHDGPIDERATFALSELGVLCDRIRATGRPVDLRVDPVTLAPSVSRAVYRIVQEALTNAARHSDSGPISVSIDRSRSDATVNVTVWNALAYPIEPHPGRGLINMRERAVMEGGQLQYGSIDGGFQVRARLPVVEGEAQRS